MNIVRLILKEAGGRFKNAGGAIDSESNMFAGSSGNAPSDKIGMGTSGKNPFASEDEEKEAAPSPVEETNTSTPEADTTDVSADDAGEIMSDGNLKTYKQMESQPLKGRLKNLQLDPMKAMSKGSGGGGMNIGGMANMIKGFGGFGGGAEGADMGADASDMGDMADAADAADAASDERLKRIFGDNEDAIKCFANINAIEFTYNDKAHDIPGGAEKGIDDDPHYGVKAQELAENPLTQTAVSKDPISEYLQVDTKELTMANTAIISEICKRILIIEKVLGIKVV